MKLKKEELIELAKKIMNADGKTEEENDELIQYFLDNVPDPYASDYFFDIQYESLNAEEIVNKALNYKPIQL